MVRIKYYLLALLVALLPVTAVSCGGDDEPSDPAVTTDFDVDFTLPASIVATKGGDCSFTVNNSKAPLSTDMMLLENGGLFFECPIKAVSTESFTVTLPKSITSGTYRVTLKRGDRRKSFGSTSIQVVDRIIEAAEGSTVYGVITTPDGQALPGVQVSDGVEIVTTDADGVYQMASKKPYGYVFMILPSGYEAESDGVLPRIFKPTHLAANLAERADFILKPVGNQDNYKILFLGDMHLADRTNDRAQFREICADINQYRTTHGGDKIYAITLGDMTWDLYWYSRKYSFKEYLADINKEITGLQIFHTMGNHDNDMMGTNNMEAKSLYRTTISPNYYSFNIGKIHYVVLDDIDCSTYDGTESRNYVQRLTDDQLLWLAKDLAAVAKTTPVIIMMHAPVFYPSGATGTRYDLKNHDELLAAVNGYNVHFVTGHTHKNYNIVPSTNLGNGNIYEHNVAAVCSDWWWSGNLTPGCLVSTDGTPAGYGVWDFTGTDFNYIYKSAKMAESIQFRSYDLNNVSFSKDGKKAGFAKFANAYPENTDNKVLINIWNYNPKWTVTVKTQGGQSLDVKAVQAYDPLHIAAQTEKRFVNADDPGFQTAYFTHFFQVVAPDADTDLVITVKDEFGHTWTENMARPKAFSTDAYSVK